ncbi:unnamed protein product [Withania somnifera]
MREHSAADSSSTDSTVTVKRYAPPNQRNRALGRRKSGGDRLERASSYASDGEKNQMSASKYISTVADAGVNRVNEYPPAKLIPLQGCSTGEASQLLNDRWTAALNAHNNLPEDSLGKLKDASLLINCSVIFLDLHVLKFLEFLSPFTIQFVLENA